MFMEFSFCFLFSIKFLKFSINEDATDIKASSGQGKNQSIVHSANKAGNFLDLSLNFYPTGEKHNTICKLSLTLSTKYANNSEAGGS